MLARRIVPHIQFAGGNNLRETGEGTVPNRSLRAGSLQRAPHAYAAGTVRLRKSGGNSTGAWTSGQPRISTGTVIQTVVAKG